MLYSRIAEVKRILAIKDYVSEEPQKKKKTVNEYLIDKFSDF